jgi:hypothetical protein
VHIHAISVPEGVTLLEFEGPSEEEEEQLTSDVQEAQLSEEVPDEVVVECPDHRSCNFMKGKPRSILSLLISEIQLSTMFYILLHYVIGVD